MAKRKKRVPVTEDMAIEMWEMYKGGATYSVIAGKFGCSAMTVRNSVMVYDRAMAMGKEVPPPASQMTRLGQYNAALDKVVKAILAKPHTELVQEELRNLTVSLAMLTDKIRLLSEEPTAIRKTISAVQEMSDEELERLVKGGEELEKRDEVPAQAPMVDEGVPVVAQERPA
jgi:hypothetical protein